MSRTTDAAPGPLSAIDRAGMNDSHHRLTELIATIAAAVPDLLRTDRRAPEAVAGSSWATLDAHLDRTHGRRSWACARGCTACCHETVPLLFPEGWLIATTLVRSCSPADLAGLRPEVDRRAAVAAGCASPQEYLLQRLPCAFLDPAGSCAVHRARPLACRSHHSMDRTACDRRLAQDPRQTVAYDIVASALGGAVVSGIQRGCAAQGLDQRSFELHALVGWCLDHPRAASDWLDGGRVPLPAYVEAVPA